MVDTSSARAIEDLPLQFNAATDLIDHNLVAGRGSKVAIVDDYRGAVSYAELSDRIDRVAAVMAQIGVGREQRVLLCLLDSADFTVAFLGAIKCGAIPVPLNTLLVEDDYRWLLQDSGAAAVFVSGELTEAWRSIANDNPQVKFVSCGGGPWSSFDDLLGRGVAVKEAAATHRDQVAFWLYTSGSTGRPKGAMHVHSSMRLTANLFGQGVINYGPEDVVLSVAKQFFAYGLGNSVSFPLSAGACTILNSQRSTATHISSLLRQHQVTILNGVPTFFAGWFASPDAPKKSEIPKLRIATSAGECLPAKLGEEFRSRFGIDVIDGLGSTEMLHIYLCQKPGEVRLGCTGKVVPGYNVRIVDPNGDEVGTGILGELQVSGPTSAIGYWKNRPKSLDTFRGKWIRTGDQYQRDSEGWYTYAARSDDMIKVGGIYVSPPEVEQALCSHEAVLEAAVVGWADENGLIKPRAFVVAKPGKPVTDSLKTDLKLHVKSLLAPYKYPRWIDFVDDLPKTATGKVQRFKLRADVR